MFDRYWRQRGLASLKESFDLIVIGGGITGCGIAFDAAQRGLRTLLVERGDIACGTSSRSSKLIHGGLRYLKQMQFGVTLQACRERDRMLGLSPHLVRPLPFLYPAYEGDRTPGWQVDLGLWMYDRLTSKPQRHTHLEAAEVEELAPGLVIEDLDRAMLYTDALADDARLTLAVAATAYAYGASVLTRMALEEPLRDERGRLQGALLRDLEARRVLPVHGRMVVNATGHWVDAVRQRFGFDGQRVRPSRGTHLILSTDRLPIRGALTVASPDDSRPVFIIPHPEGVLVGTTDLYHEGSLDDPRATEGEVGYLLRAVAAVFPDRSLERGDVVGVFAGLRPILATHGDNPSEASREEEIWEEDGLLSVAGGKLTTWRPTAEEAVDEVIRRLPDERADRLSPCATKGTPLAWLAPTDLSEQLVTAGRLSEAVATGMARRLGARAWQALEAARRRGELAPLVEGADLCAAEVRVHLATGAVSRLEDLLLRRVRLGMWNPVLAEEVAPRLRGLFAEELGWRRERWRRELEGFAAAAAAWRPAGIAS